MPLKKPGSVLKRNFNDFYLIYKWVSFLGIGVLEESSLCVGCDMPCPYRVRPLDKRRRAILTENRDINCVITPISRDFFARGFGSIHPNSVKI